MKRMISNDDSGFTLLELIVALAIFGLVVATIVSLQIYGLRGFNAGTNQSDLQNDLRIVANQISKEVRYAENFQIYTAVPAFDNQYKYIYLDPIDNLIKFRIGNGAPAVLAGNAGVVDITFAKSSTRLLRFTISESINSQDFTIESDIDLFNLGSNTILGDSTGSVIRFGPISDVEIVAQDMDTLKLGITETSSNITLPITGEAGSTISWSVVGSSPYLSILGSVGTVVRPPLGSADAIITLAALVTKNAETLTMNFTLTIKAQNLDNVTLDVANGRLSNTTSSMFYRIEPGTWIQASEGSTFVVFTPGAVQIRDSSNTINREVGIILERDTAPTGITLSDKSSNHAIFNLNGNRVLAIDNLEYKLNTNDWADILDSTNVKSNGSNDLLVRHKATSIALPSLETSNLD